MSLSHESQQMRLVQRYRQLVLDYEALDKRIDELITRHEGGRELMLPADIASYRELARQRTALQNDMRICERQLKIEDFRDNN